MEEGVRSGGSSDVVLKNRNSSGCLIVRRKVHALAGGNGSLDSRKVYMSKKEKKRRRKLTSDSGSGDEILAAPRRRVGPETIRVCNDLTAFEKRDVEESEIGRKRDQLEGIQHNDGGYFGNNGSDESERKRSKLDVFEFNEYDSIDGGRMQSPYYDESGVAFRGRRFSGSVHIGRSGIDREFEAGSSRHVVDNRKNVYVERTSNINWGNNRFENGREGSLLRDKFASNSDQAIRLQGKNGVLKVLVNKKKGIGGPLEKYKFHRAEDHLKPPRAEDTSAKNVVAPPFYREEKILKKSGSSVRSEKKHANSRKSLPTKNSKRSNWDSEDSEASLKLKPENVVRSSKRVSVEHEDPPCEKITPNKSKEGKVRRGSGTEKQKLRERIRVMLVDAAWTIDYRPRRNRDYLDAVYINPSGTAYWSIIKAYEAFQKQVNEEDSEPKPSADCSSLRLIPDEDLCQLTRKTRKKIEKEMKKKQREGSDSENAKEIRVKRSAIKKHDLESMDSASNDEKLSSFLKQGGKAFKSRTNENGFVNENINGRDLQDIGERPACGSNSHMLHGRKIKKLGRCTFVRSSNKGLNSETDGFVPYTGKRTVLSWLIDSGTVHLRQKVMYKNRRRSRVMLEGWITREGIHCACCSKILTISKFEIHAASKLRQPYQNMFLESGVSLMQCQMDAWNKQEGSEHAGFHSVDVDGDDPHDDTCGICGDGGDLICCDGCPSTFHQSCLHIEMLPPGDWHCPNCTCKFCGIAAETLAEEDDKTSTLLSCSLCEKKYHESCAQDIDANSVDSSGTDPYFCGQKCKELFEHLQKYIGTKHDLEAGYSWSIIRRTDEDSKISHRGIPQRVECNSKLAVAMTVMDECFLPIVDRRSGINLIRNVLYNCGSNFNRLNYSGFYTAILERGDEIICAASIRFHGTKLAEMPFIGTRHIYRRQGMCRRLFGVIESALCSLKVEKLIIPAISELTNTWTEVFGFTPLEEALKREMTSMSMLVFPGIDMLQKILVEQEHKTNITTIKGEEQMEFDEEQCSKPELVVKPDVEVPTRIDPNGCDDDTDLNRANETTDGIAATESASQGGVVKIDSDASTDNVVRSGKPDIAAGSGSECVVMSSEKQHLSPEHVDQDTINETTRSDSASGAEISETISGCKNFSTSHEVVTENQPSPDLVVEHSSSEFTPELENPEPINNRNACSDSDSPSSAKLSETTSSSMNLSPFKPRCNDVLLNVFPKIENPDPMNNGTVCSSDSFKSLDLRNNVSLKTDS